MALGSEPLGNGGVITHSLSVSNVSLHKSHYFKIITCWIFSDRKYPFLLATGLLEPTFVRQAIWWQDSIGATLNIHPSLNAGMIHSLASFAMAKLTGYFAEGIGLKRALM